MWIDAGENETALACFEEACACDGTNASLHFCRTVALVKVRYQCYCHGYKDSSDRLSELAACCKSPVLLTQGKLTPSFKSASGGHEQPGTTSD